MPKSSIRRRADERRRVLRVVKHGLIERRAITDDELATLAGHVRKNDEAQFGIRHMKLLDLNAHAGATLLRLAAAQGNHKIMWHLLRAGANPAAITATAATAAKAATAATAVTAVDARPLLDQLPQAYAVYLVVQSLEMLDRWAAANSSGSSARAAAASCARCRATVLLPANPAAAVEVLAISRALRIAEERGHTEVATMLRDAAAAASGTPRWASEGSEGSEGSGATENAEKEEPRNGHEPLAGKETSDDGDVSRTTATSTAATAAAVDAAAVDAAPPFTDHSLTGRPSRLLLWPCGRTDTCAWCETCFWRAVQEAGLCAEVQCACCSTCSTNGGGDRTEDKWEEKEGEGGKGGDKGGGGVEGDPAEYPTTTRAGDEMDTPLDTPRGAAASCTYVCTAAAEAARVKSLALYETLDDTLTLGGGGGRGRGGAGAASSGAGPAVGAAAGAAAGSATGAAAGARGGEKGGKLSWSERKKRGKGSQFKAQSLRAVEAMFMGSAKVRRDG
jgi:hypothetical protein